MEDDLKVRSHVLSWTAEEKERILEAIGEVLETGHVVLGPWTERFEREYAAACGREYAVAMGSDTAAFETLLKIIDVRGRAVLYPALGFASLLESVHNAGGYPVFVDANLSGHLFANADEVDRAIKTHRNRNRGQGPKALILMHTGGLLARDSAEIEKVCAVHDVTVFEDAAHCFGARLDGCPAGSYGVASAFSLYGTKPMHACEGGMIVTNDEGIAAEAKIYRNYGRIADFGRSVVVRHGYSWRMTEMQAIVGLVNLRGIGPNIERRRDVMAMYDQLIAADPELNRLKKLPLSAGMEPNGYRYILLLPESASVETKMEMKGLLREQHGVDLPGDVYELPATQQPVWEGLYSSQSMPVAEEFCRRHFSLPVYQTLTDGQIQHVVDSLASVVKKLRI